VSHLILSCMNENHLAEEQSAYARNPAIQLPSCIEHPQATRESGTPTSMLKTQKCTPQAQAWLSCMTLPFGSCAVYIWAHMRADQLHTKFDLLLRYMVKPTMQSACYDVTQRMSCMPKHGRHGKDH
jgi:hypothetical protein